MVVAFFILLAQFFIVAFLYFRLPPLIPLFNSLAWGRERLAQKELIFFVPFFLVSIAALNIFFSTMYYKKQALLSRMLSFNVLLLCILGSISIAQIFFLVF